MFFTLEIILHSLLDLVECQVALSKAVHDAASGVGGMTPLLSNPPEIANVQCDPKKKKNPLGYLDNLPIAEGIQESLDSQRATSKFGLKKFRKAMREHFMTEIHSRSHQSCHAGARILR